MPEAAVCKHMACLLACRQIASIPSWVCSVKNPTSKLPCLKVPCWKVPPLASMPHVCHMKVPPLASMPPAIQGLARKGVARERQRQLQESGKGTTGQRHQTHKVDAEPWKRRSSTVWYHWCVSCLVSLVCQPRTCYILT